MESGNHMYHDIGTYDDGAAGELNTIMNQKVAFALPLVFGIGSVFCLISGCRNDDVRTIVPGLKYQDD